MDSTDRKSTKKALGYVSNPATEQWEVADSKDRVELASGAGALFTTTGDLWKWAQAVNNEQLLSKELYRNAFTPVQAGYGLGWILGDHNGHPKLGHT